MVVPRGLFARDYVLVREGEVVATLKLALFKESCEFTLRGHQFAIRRNSIWKDGFEFFCDDALICERESRFLVVALTRSRPAINMDSAASRLFLSSPSIAQRRARGRPDSADRLVHAANGSPHFAENVPPPIQVLSIFVVLILARREQQSAGS